MRTYRLYQVDSFTTEKFQGNPAGVVSNAKGLSELEMQRIACELNNSETAFVFPSVSSDHDVQVRFFTPTTEVPICGHATIAAHYVKATEGKLNSTTVIQKTGVGNLPVEVIREHNDYKIVMTQGEIDFGATLEGRRRQTLLSALRVTQEDLAAQFPIQVASTGHSKVMIGIRSKEILNAISPDLRGLTELSTEIGCNGYYLFVFDLDDPEVLINGRMFAPAIGIEEDPVTGNANGALGAYLVHHKLVSHNNSEFRFKSRQGEAIGRVGIVEVAVKIENAQPVRVEVGGKAVIVYKTIIHL
jgi:PhzF family phenazine biosynthesis protein